MCEVQVSKCVLFFALENEWHNKGTILIYASADCLPLFERCVAKKRKYYVREVGESPKGRGNVLFKVSNVHPFVEP